MSTPPRLDATPTRVRAEMARLVALSTGPTPSDASVQSALDAFTPRDLVLADELFRRDWYSYRDDLDALRPRFAAGEKSAIWLISMSRDGHARERAVVLLGDDPSRLADRLLALRLGDPVNAVRLRAWDAVAQRCNPEQGALVAPILVAMAGRQRAADALDRYAAIYSNATGTSLWSAMSTSQDRPTRRRGIDRWLTSAGPTAPDVLDALAAERDQFVVTQLTRHLADSQEPAIVEALLKSRHSIARASAIENAPDEQLHDDVIMAGLLDRTARVRSAARFRAGRRQLDSLGFYLAHWRSDDEPRALHGAIESGATFTRGELRSLLSDARAQVRILAIGVLARDDLEPEDLRLLATLLDDPATASVATRALSKSFAWSYAELIASWVDADPVKRRRLWRLLSSRGGWDRVRGSLLAATDPDPAIAGQGRADLRAWLANSAARMYRPPTADQLADLVRDLPTAGLPHALRADIEFRAGLPVTPTPGPQWTPLDALLPRGPRRSRRV